MKPELTAYCLDWHTNRSSAFVDVLVEPFVPYANIKLMAWDGDKLPGKLSTDKPVIFCMLPPPPAILKKPGLKIIWIPMWDQAQGYDQTWWEGLPKNVKIVAFSEIIFRKATAAGLEVIKLQYFPNSSHSKKVVWKDGYNIFYWNRTGLVGPEFLEKLCKVTSARRLLFRGEIDPRISPNMKYRLPSKLGNTSVEEVVGFNKDPGAYLASMESANIYIAPRATEGIGLTFLEAMASGAAVIAHDAPTMNEYITHNKNGVLLSDDYVPVKDRLLRLSHDKNEFEPFLLSNQQPWKQLGRFKYEKLGKQASLDSEVGYKKWLSSIDDYASFVLNW